MDGDTSGRTRHFPGHDPHRDGPAFSRDGGRWRSVEWPGLTMVPGDRYEVDGCDFDSLAEALAKTGPSAGRLPEA